MNATIQSLCHRATLVGALLVSASFAGALTGCSPSSTPAAATPNTLGGENVALENVGPLNDSAPPGDVEVGWTDNGTPIRPLSGPGRERELVKPVTAGHHRSSLSVAPPSNADGFGGAKKKTASKK